MVMDLSSSCPPRAVGASGTPDKAPVPRPPQRPVSAQPAMCRPPSPFASGLPRRRRGSVHSSRQRGALGRPRASGPAGQSSTEPHADEEAGVVEGEGLAPVSVSSPSLTVGSAANGVTTTPRLAVGALSTSGGHRHHGDLEGGAGHCPDHAQGPHHRRRGGPSRAPTTATTLQLLRLSPYLSSPGGGPGRGCARPCLSRRTRPSSRVPSPAHAPSPSPVPLAEAAAAAAVPPPTPPPVPSSRRASREAQGLVVAAEVQSPSPRKPPLPVHHARLSAGHRVEGGGGGASARGGRLETASGGGTSTASRSRGSSSRVSSTPSPRRAHRRVGWAAARALGSYRSGGGGSDGSRTRRSSTGSGVGSSPSLPLSSSRRTAAPLAASTASADQPEHGLAVPAYPPAGLDPADSAIADLLSELQECRDALTFLSAQQRQAQGELRAVAEELAEARVRTQAAQARARHLSERTRRLRQLRAELAQEHQRRRRLRRAVAAADVAREKLRDPRGEAAAVVHRGLSPNGFQSPTSPACAARALVHNVGAAQLRRLSATLAALESERSQLYAALAVHYGAARARGGAEGPHVSAAVAGTSKDDPRNDALARAGGVQASAVVVAAAAATAGEAGAAADDAVGGPAAGTPAAPSPSAAVGVRSAGSALAAARSRLRRAIHDDRQRLEDLEMRNIEVRVATDALRERAERLRASLRVYREAERHQRLLNTHLTQEEGRLAEPVRRAAAAFDTTPARRTQRPSVVARRQRRAEQGEVLASAALHQGDSTAVFLTEGGV